MHTMHRKCAANSLNGFKASPSKAGVNYVQMQLQVDREALDSDVSSDIFFSPVLLWRPGKEHRPPPPPPVSTEIPSKHQGDKTASSAPLQPHPQPPTHTPLPAPHISLDENGDGKKEAEQSVGSGGDGGMRRVLSGKKSPLLVKTTDLTDALPPQESLESTVNEKKVF